MQGYKSQINVTEKIMLSVYYQCIWINYLAKWQRQKIKINLNLLKYIVTIDLPQQELNPKQVDFT